jgi:hypothetical protein
MAPKVAGIIGIPGRLRSEWVAGFDRNGRPTSIGIPGRIHRNPQTTESNETGPLFRPKGAQRRSAGIK